MSRWDEGFGAYMNRKGKAKKRAAQSKHCIGQLSKWMDEQGLEVEDLQYKHIMDYMDYCSTILHNGHNTITDKVRIIKYWLTYRGIDPNPCEGWLISRRSAKMYGSLLTTIEVDQMYSTHPDKSQADKIDKVMLGLLIYQGMNSGHVFRLDISDINLEVGFIIIKKTFKSAPRSIKISKIQATLLEEYVVKIRPELVKQSENQESFLVGPRKDWSYFFVRFYRKLRELHPDFINNKHLRASVITNWLKTANLREVQYKAGHKYVSSTERYQLNNVDDLQKQIDTIHPLK